MNKQQLLEQLLYLDEDKFNKLYTILNFTNNSAIVKEAIGRVHCELNEFYNLYHEFKDCYATKESFGNLLIDNFNHIVKSVDILDEIIYYDDSPE